MVNFIRFTNSIVCLLLDVNVGFTESTPWALSTGVTVESLYPIDHVRERCL